MNEYQPLSRQTRGSRPWRRIVLGVLGVVLLVLVVYAIGIIASLWYYDTHRHTVGEAMPVAEWYYHAIQQQDYASACRSMASNAIITVQGRPMLITSADTLATLSQALDTRQGRIRSVTDTNGNFEQGRDIVDLTMQVTRANHSSEVHLRIELVGSDWKILSADGI